MFKYSGYIKRVWFTTMYKETHFLCLPHYPKRRFQCLKCINFLLQKCLSKVYSFLLHSQFHSTLTSSVIFVYGRNRRNSKQSQGLASQQISISAYWYSRCCSCNFWVQKASLSTDKHLKVSMSFCKQHINHRCFKTHTYKAHAPVQQLTLR